MERKPPATYGEGVTNAHHLAFHGPQFFGILAILANIAVAVAVKRDPRSQIQLTLAAVGVTVLAVSILLPSSRRTVSNPTGDPSAVFYPSAEPSASIPAALQYRIL